MTLRAEGAAGIAGLGDGPVITVESGAVVLAGLTLTGGAGAPTESWLGGLPLRAGAGVFAEAATALTVEDCVLRDMTADWGVGITGPLGGTLTVVDSTFENLDGLAGPAAIAHRGSDARVSGSDFIFNGAAAPHAVVGTTVDLQADAVTVEASTFVGNGQGSAFAESAFDRVGGGLRVRATAATLRDLSFDDNDASYGGGAHIEAQRLIGEGLAAGFNLAGRAGGGLYLVTADGQPADWRLVGVELASNDAPFGGGLAASLEGALVLSDLEATGNEGAALSLAGRSGGASVSVDQALLTDNAGTGFGGGGIHAVDLDALSVHQSRLSSNQGLAGGALSASNVADLRLTSTVLADNVASTFGAGLYAADSGVTLEDASLLRNTGGTGTGAYLTGATLEATSTDWGAGADDNGEPELTTPAGDTHGVGPAVSCDAAGVCL